MLAARHAVAKGGRDKPFIAGGHSTGAALLTLYSLRSLTDPSLPRPQHLHLVSAAIGISPFSGLTSFVSELAWQPGIEKSAWIDVFPEYEPVKYNSFSVNAANQIYKVTRQVQDTLDELAPAELAVMPRVHLYQSIVDSTVTANAVLQGLLVRLPATGHELTVFDVNRHESMEKFVASGPLEDLAQLRTAAAFQLA